MITYHRTSLFSSSAQTIVNTVNCVGVMGKGIAAEFKKRYPEMYSSYRKICDQKMLETGKLWLWRGPDQWVLNFPTKRHWRSPSRLEWIEAGLKKFVTQYEQQGINEIAFPKLGCGNGNLDWEVVRPLMEQYLDPLPISVFIHDHTVNVGLPEHLAAIVSEQNCRPAPSSFDDAWGCIRNISERVGSSMIDIEHDEPFRMIANDGTLLVETERDRSFIDKEELVDVWRILNSGILTKSKLRYSDPKEASRLISVFCLLPRVRPVQIETTDSRVEEVAAEINYRSHSAVPNSAQDREQYGFQWH